MIIATRTLVVREDGQDKPVQIRLLQPEQVGVHSWDCRYEIDWPNHKISSFAGGNDGLAAIFAAIEKIGMEVYMSRYHHERTMWWLKPWEGYGLPLPKGARDDLIGDDQRYFGLE